MGKTPHLNHLVILVSWRHEYIFAFLDHHAFRPAVWILHQSVDARGVDFKQPRFVDIVGTDWLGGIWSGNSSLTIPAIGVLIGSWPH